MQYRCIGRGNCGSVWTTGESDCAGLEAVKFEDGMRGRSVTNDHDRHIDVLNALSKCNLSTPLSFPKCFELLPASSNWWNTRSAMFPADQWACKALLTERIPPVPRAISNKIVDICCADNLAVAHFVKNNPADDDCLIRPYLGRRRETARTSRFQRFTLRNVPLHVNQMDLLGLDIESYAEAMAEALALMHWVAKIDANDVEFVLAPQRTAEQHHNTATFESTFLGAHCMWILDFDSCHPLEMSEAGIERACAAFFRNDPYYPRPATGIAADEELWSIFKARFLVDSRRFLSADHLFLAAMLVEKIENEGELRRRKKEQLHDARE